MVSLMLYSCIFCVSLLMDLFALCVACLTVFVNCVFGCAQRMCVLCLYSQCASRCSCHMFCLCVCMSEVISSFRNLRAGSHMFVLLMLFLSVILHIMWSGKSLQLLCIFSFAYCVCLPSEWHCVYLWVL